MSLTLTIDDQPHTVDATTTAAELFVRLRPEVDPGASGYWLLAREDGAKYIENPQRKDVLVTTLLEDGEPAPLYLEQPERCRHGSPGVRNHGFLCGWC